MTKDLAETEPERSISGCLLWVFWLWLVSVGFFSFVSGIAVGGCSGPSWRACEVSVTRIWIALMVAQGVVFVAGIVFTQRHRLNALIWLAVVSPALVIIALLFYGGYTGASS